MTRKPVPTPPQPVEDDPAAPRFPQVVAVIVGLENYRKPKSDTLKAHGLTGRRACTISRRTEEG